MKRVFLFSILVISFANVNSQAVGIGTTSPSSSSLLDISSTTKGMLMPRMTSAQRIAISSPVSGLLVFDTDTKTLWAHDGTAWKNLYTSGGGLTLPFSQTVNTAISAFQVTNQGAGAAIEGSSTAQFGIGMTAKTTGEGGWGLLAFSNGAGSQSIRSYADNGTAFHGENNNPVNTNTLMNLLNKGAGKTGSFQLTNNSSTSPNVQVAGNHLGEQLKIYQTNAANTSAAVSIENSGTGAGLHSVANGIGVSGSSTNGNGIYGTTTSATGYGVHGYNASGTGILGSSNTSTGVYGSSISGTGVIGYSTSGIGLNTSSINGTGLYTSSINGLALNVNGNLKISGGITNPAAGKVLTSDASGNATWQTPVVQTPKVGFRAYGVSSFETAGTPNNEIPNNTFKKVEFQTESYDSHGSFFVTGNSTATSIKSTYTTPLRGVYHFDAAVTSGDNVVFNHYSHTLRLMLNRNGSVSTIAEIETTPETLDGSAIQLSMDVFLEADDIIWLEFKHFNLSFSAITLETSGIKAFISGHLIYTQ